jgi:carboxyl-terminal processing protease
VNVIPHPAALTFFALAFLFCGNLAAQQPLNAQSTYEYIQKERADAEKLWKQKDERGINALNKLLDSLHSPAAIDLAAGNFYLRKSLSDIHYDLARAYALQGDRAAALSQLEQVIEGGGIGVDPDCVAKEPAFDTLKQEPIYRKVLAQLTAQKRLWSDAAFNTPYQEVLSPEEKLAGLSEFWAEVKFNFVNFDHVPELDWDATYQAYIPKVLQTKNTANYYRVLQEMCALLKDAHTTVDHPEQLLDEFYGRPPIWTGMVEGKVLILKVGPAGKRSVCMSGRKS